MTSLMPSNWCLSQRGHFTYYYQIPHINESISDHHAIINKLERQISLIAEKLSSLHNINKSSVPVPSSAELSVNYIQSDLYYTWFLRPNLYEVNCTVRHLLFAVFGTKISYAQVLRIIEV